MRLRVRCAEPVWVSSWSRRQTRQILIQPPRGGRQAPNWSAPGLAAQDEACSRDSSAIRPSGSCRTCRCKPHGTPDYPIPAGITALKGTSSGRGKVLSATAVSARIQPSTTFAPSHSLVSALVNLRHPVVLVGPHSGVALVNKKLHSDLLLRKHYTARRLLPFMVTVSRKHRHHPLQSRPERRLGKGKPMSCRQQRLKTARLMRWWPPVMRSRRLPPGSSC